MLNRLAAAIHRSVHLEPAQECEPPAPPAAYRRLVSSAGLEGADLHVFRGRLWYRLGFYDKAAAEFRAALRLNWRHEQAAAWIRLAELAGKAAARGAAPAPRGVFRPIATDRSR